MSNRCAGGPQPPVDGIASAQLAAIDTIVVLMLENRSFDNFLGGLRMDPTYPSAAALDGLSGNEEIPDDKGTMTQLLRMVGNGAVDPKHDWVSSRTAFNGGRNDGFLLPNLGMHQNEVMSYFGPDRMPFMHALAARVHRLRPLVLVGDGPDLAEPLLPPRGHGRRRTRPTCRWGCRRAAHDLGADGRPLLDREELLLGPAALVLAGVPGQELLGRRRADAGAASITSSADARGRARCPTSRSSIRTSRPTTATRPTISRCARRSSPASTARSPRARSGRARCSWWCSTSTAASSTTSRRR